MKSEMDALGARKCKLTGMLPRTEEPATLRHPNLAEIYHQRISTLYRDLQNEEITAQAAHTSARW